jgi:histidyl-tRNA synthetase
MSSESSPIEPRLLKGFRDALPNRLIARNLLIQQITNTLELFGFQPLETPALEYAEILEGKLGDEGEKLLYKFTDHGQRQVAMRYDFTIPLARVAAQYPELPKPFKRYQVGPVWRADNTQRGRYREFYQFDMDTVGTSAAEADAEILVLIQNILQSLKIENFVIRINHRHLLHDTISDLKINPELEKAIFTSLDKADKIGLEATIASWNNLDLTEKQIEGLKSFVTDPTSSNAAEGYLGETLNLAESMGLNRDKIKIDGTIVRGLDYYTGIVFETTLIDAPEYGSVFSGGRYDGLIGRFSKQDIPAVGASVGLDRLMAALEQIQLLPITPTTTKAFVTIFNQDLAAQSHQIAQMLRQGGINTEISYQTGSIGKQLKLASSKSIRHAIIMGPDEAEAGNVTLRDLESGKEQLVKTDELVKAIQSKL